MLTSLLWCVSEYFQPWQKMTKDDKRWQKMTKDDRWTDCSSTRNETDSECDFYFSHSASALLPLEFLDNYRRSWGQSSLLMKQWSSLHLLRWKLQIKKFELWKLNVFYCGLGLIRLEATKIPLLQSRNIPLIQSRNIPLIQSRKIRLLWAIVIMNLRTTAGRNLSVVLFGDFWKQFLMETRRKFTNNTRDRSEEKQRRFMAWLILVEIDSHFWWFLKEVYLNNSLMKAWNLSWSVVSVSFASIIVARWRR